MNTIDHRSSRYRRAARALAASERGSAIITTVGVLFMTMSLAGVAAGASLLSQSGANRDKQVKGALAVADAGAQAALWRQNQILTTDLLPCLVEGVGGELVPGPAEPDGWCAAITGTAGNGSYSYRVKAPLTLQEENLLETRIVSTGTAGGETRRVMTVVRAPIGAPLFNGNGVTSLDDLTVKGNGKIGSTPEPTSAVSNSSVVLEGSSSVCGNIIHGVGGNLIGEEHQCSGYTVGTASTTLSPVDQGTVATKNDNGRLSGAPPPDPSTGNVTWESGPRRLTMTGNSTLSLGGSNYSLCELSMSGSSKLIISAAAEVTLWFDSPEDCGQADGHTQMSITGTARFVNTSGDPTHLQIYFLGSDEIETNISMAGNSTLGQALVLHAPRSDLSITGNTTVRGAVAAEQVTIDGNSSVTWLDDVGDLEEELVPLYERTRYVECLNTPGLQRDDRC